MKQLPKEKLLELADAIADGLPIGELAGIAGMSWPTMQNRLANPDFIASIVIAFDEPPSKKLWKRLEWYSYHNGERETSYQLRHYLARLLRLRFHEQDEAERERAKKPGHYLIRGGEYYTWHGDGPGRGWRTDDLEPLDPEDDDFDEDEEDDGDTGEE